MTKNTEDKTREIAERIVALTRFGGSLHINDILPDLQELSSLRKEELQSLVEEIEKLKAKNTHVCTLSCNNDPLFHIEREQDMAERQGVLNSVLGIIKSRISK